MEELGVKELGVGVEMKFIFHIYRYQLITNS